MIRSDVGTPHFFRVLRKCIEATIGFFDYVVTVNTPSQILRSVNSEKFKGFNALDNNCACTNVTPGPTTCIIIKKVNRHGFTVSWIKAHVVAVRKALDIILGNFENLSTLGCNLEQSESKKFGKNQDFVVVNIVRKTL